MAEKEYIDVAQLFKCETCYHMVDDDEMCNSFCDCGESYRPALSKLKTADVVEVVRCKDCKKRGQRDCIVNRKMACGDHETTTKANDFCSFGERKDDNHEASDGN